jgi:hypothetical protein
MTSEELQKAYTQYVNNMGNNGAGALMPYNQEFASQFGQQQPYQYYYPTVSVQFPVSLFTLVLSHQSTHIPSAL